MASLNPKRPATSVYYVTADGSVYSTKSQALEAKGAASSRFGGKGGK